MDYKNGKIYKIVDNAYTKMYIGSTTRKLCKRFYDHRSGYKKFQLGKYDKITVFDIFDEFGIENCKIELIENYPCSSKEELERREGELIKDNICVNKIIPRRTEKEYYEDNKEKIKERKDKYNTIYYQNNKGKIKEKTKNYYELNKDIIKEKTKIYQSQIINCVCGLQFRRDNKSKHLKTKKHQKHISQIIP